MSSLCKIPTDVEKYTFSIFDYFVCKSIYILIKFLSPNNFNLDDIFKTSSAMAHYIWHLHPKLWKKLCKLSPRKLHKKFIKLYEADHDFMCCHMEDSDFKENFFILRTLIRKKYHKLILEHHCPSINVNVINNIRVRLVNKKLLVIV